MCTLKINDQSSINKDGRWLMRKEVKIFGMSLSIFSFFFFFPSQFYNYEELRMSIEPFTNYRGLPRKPKRNRSLFSRRRPRRLFSGGYWQRGLFICSWNFSKIRSREFFWQIIYIRNIQLYIKLFGKKYLLN